MSKVLPSLGLASLSAYLKRMGVTTRVLGFHLQGLPAPARELVSEATGDTALFRSILDGTATAHRKPLAILDLTIEHCARRVLEDDPELVGCSVFQVNALPSLLLARELRRRSPRTKIVFGGPECRFDRNAAYFLRSGLVDAIVPGEGEEALAGLIRHYGFGSEVPGGAVVIERDRVVDRSAAASPVDMSDLPTPDFSAALAKEPPVYGVLPVAFNRGCTARCRFCAERTQWGAYRQMSVERAVEILEELVATHGVRRFYFTQSLLNGDLKWLSRFCDALLERGLAITWGGNARIHPTMDRPFLDRMYAAGCRGLDFGIESGSDAVLKDMRKGTNRKQIARVLKDAWDSGIWVHTYWILGYPSETADDALATLDFLVANFGSIDSAHLHTFNLSASSDLFHEGFASDPAKYRRFVPDPDGSLFLVKQDQTAVRSPFYRQHRLAIDHFTGLVNSFGHSVGEVGRSRSECVTLERARTNTLLALLLFRGVVSGQITPSAGWTSDVQVLPRVFDRLAREVGTVRVDGMSSRELMRAVVVAAGWTLAGVERPED